MGDRNELIGQTFGRLVVTAPAAKLKSGNFRYSCICDCGKTIITTASQLKLGRTRSCGCLRKEISANRQRTHNLSNTKEYLIWQKIKDRCYNTNDKAYNNYGGRGIVMCQEWKDSFVAFIEDMGRRPEDKKSIERINNDKGYNKENCKWATHTEQMRNTRRTRIFEYQGEIYHSITAIAKRFNIHLPTFNSRIQAGWKTEKAINCPIRTTTTEVVCYLPSGVL